MNQTLTLLLLPGLDGTGEQLRRLEESAPPWVRTRVVAYPSDAVLDYAQLEARVRADLPQEPFLLLGESFSGPIAVALAAQGSEHLRGLILAASFVTPPARRLWRFLPWTTAFRFPAPGLLVRRVLAPRDAALAQAMRASVRSVAPAVLAARVRATLAVDRTRELSAVSCPILYLEARDDRVIARRCLRKILEIKPAAQVVQLPAAHPLLQIAPEAAWKAIEEFARGLTP